MDRNQYLTYTTTDFAKDEDFIRWVRINLPADELFWSEFISLHPEKSEEIEIARRIIEGSAQMLGYPTFPQEEKEEIFQGVLDNIDSPVLQPSETGNKYKLHLWAPVAAVVLVLVMVGGSYFLKKETSIQYQTSFGQTLTITLPDSSVATLHANSRLSTTRNWEAGEDRRVWLDGEAYFEVNRKPATQAKFSVYTSDLEVQVLGTKFNVNTRQEQTQVVLSEGKIKLLLNDQEKDEIFMDPGDMINYSSIENELVHTKVNPEIHTSWKEGIQEFIKTPLSDIVSDMEETYGVKINIENSGLSQRNMTMGIPVDNQEIAMKTLEEILGVKINYHSDSKCFIIK